MLGSFCSLWMGGHGGKSEGPACEWVLSIFHPLVLSADSRARGVCALDRTPDLRVPRGAYAVASCLCMHVYDNRRVVVLRRYTKAAMIRRAGTHMLRTAASASAALRASVRFCNTSTSSPSHHDSASLIFHAKNVGRCCDARSQPQISPTCSQRVASLWYVGCVEWRLMHFCWSSVQHRATRNAVAAAPCRWLNQSPVMRDVDGSDLMATLDEKPPEKVRTAPHSHLSASPLPSSVLLFFDVNYTSCPVLSSYCFPIPQVSFSHPPPHRASLSSFSDSIFFPCCPSSSAFTHAPTHSHSHDGVQVVKLATEIMALNMVLNLLALLVQRYKYWQKNKYWRRRRH